MDCASPKLNQCATFVDKLPALHFADLSPQFWSVMILVHPLVCTIVLILVVVKMVKQEWSEPCPETIANGWKSAISQPAFVSLCEMGRLIAF